MGKKKWFAASLAVIVFSSSGAICRPDAKGAYMVYGQGTDSCGTWTENRKTNGGTGDQISYGHIVWLNGYLTAYNFWAPGVADIRKSSDSDGMVGWMDVYCAAHPLNDLSTAAAELVRELRKRPSP